MTASHVDDLNPTKRFSNRVDNYSKYRPDYPKTLILRLKELFTINSKTHLADIGSGTGLLTQPLLETQAQVYAVEPNSEMRQVAEKNFSGFQNYKSISAPAEATTLPDQCVDLITVAQAFHWFDVSMVKTEFRRILKPNGQIALIWNFPKIQGSPFGEWYELLMQTHGTDYEAVKKKTGDYRERMAFLFDGYHHFHHETFSHSQNLTEEGLLGRIFSNSFVPQMNEPGYEALVNAIRAGFERFQTNGWVQMDYLTELYWGKLASAP